MNILLHINKYILRFSMLLLFAVGGVLCAQAQDVVRTYSVNVDFVDEDWQNFASIYQNNVYIYGFDYKEDAQKALESLKSSYDVDNVRNATRKKIRPDKDGTFKITIDRNGFILIWINDIDLSGKYIPRIIDVYDTKDKQKFNIEKSAVAKNVQDGDKLEEEIDEKTGEKFKKFDKAVEFTSTFVSGGRADVNTSKEVNGVVTSRMDFMIPYRTTSNMRVVVQPMWFDRADFSDEDSDTIYSYGKFFYKDKVEYKFTQKRRMAFDLMNDSLYRYSMAIADQRVYDIIGSDSVFSNVTFTPKSDSIHVVIIDTVSGLDPDYSHPYPFGTVVDVYDYNAKVYSMEKKGNGERKVPLKFLDFSFKEFLPNPANFIEQLDNEPQETNDVVKLNFASGKDYIIDDSVNTKELNRIIDYVKMLSDEEKYEFIGINVVGVASPEGSVEGNKDLAKRRANFLVRILKQYTGRPIRITDSDVAPWETVADTLEQFGYPERAAEIRAICEKYPGKMQEQYVQVAKLPYYRPFLIDSILPALRTVRYIAKYNEVRQLTPKEVISKYYKDKNYRFSRGEFWSLFENLKDPVERERVARHALMVTKKSGAEYNEGYWAYAACLLACQYIARDTADFKILKPFLDFNKKKVISDTIKAGETMPTYEMLVANNDTVIRREITQELRAGEYLPDTEILLENDTAIVVLKIDSIKAGEQFTAVKNIVLQKDTILKKEIVDTKLIKKHPETRGVIRYTNFPEVAANQLIMALRQKDRARNNDIPVLEAITADGGAKYDTLLYFSKCLRGGYMPGGEFSENEASKIRNIVSSTSATNSVIIKLAMEDDANLNAAVKVSENLPDNAVSDYLKAIIKLRKNSKPDAEKLLARSFVREIKMIPIACNDEDFISHTDTEHNNVVRGALKLWQDTMRTIVTVEKKVIKPAPVDTTATDSVAPAAEQAMPDEFEEEEPEYNEKHPFTWYIRALEMLGDKDESNDEDGKAALFKCFDMDERYIPVLNVSLIKDNSIRNNKELKAKLKTFRNEYNQSKR